MNRPLALLQINCALRFLFIRFLEGNNGSVLFLDAHVVKGGGKLLTDFAEVDFVELFLLSICLSILSPVSKQGAQTRALQRIKISC